MYLKTHTHILRHINCRKSQNGLSISYLHKVSPLFLFLFSTPPLTWLSTPSSISLASLFPFHPATAPSRLPRFLSFSCPLWRWEIWTAPKSFNSVWPHPQLPPSSPTLLCSPPPPPPFDSSNCFWFSYTRRRTPWLSREQLLPASKTKHMHLNIQFLLLLLLFSHHQLAQFKVKLPSVLR